MEIHLKKDTFEKALSRAGSIISVREIRSTLSNILLESREDTVILTASDLELSVSIETEAKIVQAGGVTIPAKKFSEALSAFQADEFSLSVKENNRVDMLSLSKESKARISLMGSPVEDYPPVPVIESDQYKNIDISKLLNMIQYTNYAMAKDDARYVFNGLYMETEGAVLKCVSTDGRRLALMEESFSEALPVNEAIILPYKCIKELQKLEPANEASTRMAYDAEKKRVFFEIGKLRLASKLIEGSFPDYKQVIPEKVENELLLHKEGLERSLKQVSVMAAEPSRRVYFHFSENALELRASTPDLGEAEDRIAIDYQKGDLEVAFNSRYILDVLENIDTEHILFCFSTESDPAIIRIPDDKRFISVVMPMKV